MLSPEQHKKICPMTQFFSHLIILDLASLQALKILFHVREASGAVILTVVGTMQSRREWEQVVERITPNGTKSSAAAGIARLNAILDGGTQRKFGMLVGAVNNLPPATYYAGQPVVVRNLA